MLTSLEMSDAAPLPTLLYGTAWKEERTLALTTLALQSGFRGIDTANQRKHYVEAAVGKAVQAAIASGSVTRKALFLQTKFTSESGQDQRLPYDPSAPVAAQVAESLSRSLEHFATDYVDSFLLHGPSTRGALAKADVEAWRAIEAEATAGRARFIGVSNFTRAQLKELLGIAHVAPRFVQNRCYARTGWDREVRELCASSGVIYQGFSLLTANRSELGRAALRERCERLHCETAELVFRFARGLGMLPLTGTSSEAHMRLDLAAVERPLEANEVKWLESAFG